MAAPRLEQGESVIFTAHPGSWMLFGIYLFTLGLYHFWRRNQYFVVTDHRVIHTSGIVSKRQKNVPLEMVQDASLGTAFGVGNVGLSSAGGPLSVQRMGPMRAVEAREMVDVILRERKQQQGRILGANTSNSASSEAMYQLKQLSELRDSGAVSDAEFEAKKVEILGRI
jgi:membrane protein YdbS with pleckstrin-like domain